MPILRQPSNEIENTNYNKFYILPQYKTYLPPEAGKYNVLSCNVTGGGRIAFLKIIVNTMDRGKTASVYVVIDGVECGFQFSYPSTSTSSRSSAYYFVIGDTVTGEGMFRYGYLSNNGRAIQWYDYLESNVSSPSINLIPCDFKNGSTSTATMYYNESSRRTYGVPVSDNESCVYFKNNIEILYDKETSSTGIAIYFGIKYSGDITVTTENLVQ